MKHIVFEHSFIYILLVQKYKIFEQNAENHHHIIKKGWEIFDSVVIKPSLFYYLQSWFFHLWLT